MSNTDVSSSSSQIVPTSASRPRSAPLRLADLVVTIGFLTAISAPSLAMLFSGSDAEIARTEQRRAAPFPELTFRHIGPIPWLKSYCVQKFPRDFEAWYDDRVGFRRPLIRGYNLAKVFGLAVENRLALGEAGHGSVTVGREGWLFLAGKHIDRDYRRTDPFSSADLAEWRKYLAERRDRLAAAKIGYAFFVAPNQQTIYSEFMPRSITRADRPSRLDQLAAEAAREPSLPLIDPRGALIEGKKKYPTYHQTDSHWNDFGAWIGYELVMRELRRSNPNLRTTPLDEFEVRVEQVVDKGDLVRALNAPIDFETYSLTLVPREPRKAECESLTPTSVPTMRWSTNYAVASGRLLVAHDSFMEAMSPFLSEHFREVFYYNGPLSLEVVGEIRPDFVLEEIAERHLMAAVPRNAPQTESSPGRPTVIAQERDASSAVRR